MKPIPINNIEAHEARGETIEATFTLEEAFSDGGDAEKLRMMGDALFNIGKDLEDSSFPDGNYRIGDITLRDDSGAVLGTLEITFSK